MKRIEGTKGLAARACALLIVCALAGCEDSGSASFDVGADADMGLPDVPAPDAEPDIAPDGPELDGDMADDADGFPEVFDSDVPDVPDVPDTVDAELPSPDTDVTTPDVPPINPAEMVDLNCVTDETCVVNCASGGVCGEDGRCTFSALDGCLIPDATGIVAICRQPGEVEAAAPCMFCNPAFDHQGWTGTLARSGFEDGLGGFTKINALGDKDATWTVSSARSATGESSLYFGDPETMSYDTGGQAHAQVFALPVVIPPGLSATLSFSLWLETEELPGYDVLKALLRLDGGPATVVWTSDDLGGSTHGAFVQVQADLGEVGGQAVEVGFAFDTKDDLDNAYEGAYIDDVNVTTGCCASEVDCGDANPCSVDTCPAYGEACSNKVVDGCCASAFDCDDENPCTVDVCPEVGGGCEHTAIEGCCLEDGDCATLGDPCTLHTCSEPGGVCVTESLCCQSDGQCDDGDACTSDACVDQLCVHDYTCCTSDTACNDGEYCTIDTCEAGACQHAPAILPGCCSPQIENETFEGASVPFGWTGASQGGVGWTVADVGKSQSGAQVLYYGDPATGNYDDGTSNQGTITSSSIYIPGGLEVTLSFKAYLDVETASWADTLTVQIIAESNTVTVATKSNLTIKGWKTFTTDISYLAGQSVKLSFIFQTTSAANNSGLGVLIDDLVVGTTCEPKACASNATCSSQDSCLQGVCAASVCAYVNSCCYDNDECDDGQVCTVDSCIGGLCDFDPIAGCCEDTDDCSDGNACTTDVCSGYGGTCSWDDVPGCCLTHADCDDTDGCTQDKCLENECQNIWICCAADDECDDEDDVCTVDTCVDQFCAFEPTGAEGCCEANPLTWDFESAVDLTITNSSNPCTWQVTSSDQNQTPGGTQVLYYGNVAANDFNCSVNSGTVITETFSLQEGVDFTLSWGLMMDTETSTSYDKLFIYALVDGIEIEIWSKYSLSAAKGQWATYQVNFNAFAGKDVALKFYFHTIDSVLNATSGVFLDDVKVNSNCVPAPCGSNSDCDDGLANTTATCAGVGCAYSIP